MKTKFLPQAAAFPAPLVLLLLLAGLAGAAWPAAPQPAALSAAPPANPLVSSRLPEAIPHDWGNREPAARPLPRQPEKTTTQLIPMPPPHSLSRMPVGRVHVGEGRVDPSRAMRRNALYVVRAQAAGIVEYLYDQTALTRMGQPLVRLYDLSILSDLRIGESAMARFATSPFVIAPRQNGLPPLPPRDFPRATVLQRLLGLRGRSQPPATPETVRDTARTSGLMPRADLARNATLAQEPQAVETPALEKIKAPSVFNITRTTEEITEARSRVERFNSQLADLEGDLERADSDVAEARDDAGARERLYNQGVLARNLLEAAQQKVAEVEGQQRSLRAKRDDLIQAREHALQRLAALQQQLDDQVASRRQAVQELQATAPRRAPEAPHRVERPAVREPAAPVTAPEPPSIFPSPTRESRPEIARLPRLRSRGSVAPLMTSVEVPGVPMEVKRLANPRWLDQAAPGDGLVVRQLVPPGSQVKPGQPLLEIANREWARVYSDVARSDVKRFQKGAPVHISFDNYPGVTLEGWVNDVQPLPDSDLARVEMVVIAREGYCDDDTYASLEWLVLAAPLTTEDVPEALDHAVTELPAGSVGPTTIYDMLPLVPSTAGPALEKIKQVKQDEFVGTLRLGEIAPSDLAGQIKPENAKRLGKLREWRDSFTAGMQTGIFGNLVLTYPRDDETGHAVERMATARVTHVNNRCARTMREALGWGLGDAAMWLHRLPERGYRARKDGLARPGDILVWPFTYGPRRSQHIGIAVNQNGKLMLLSNLGGTLGTSELLGGYVAFYKPAEPARPADKHAAATPAQQTE